MVQRRTTTWLQLRKGGIDKLILAGMSESVRRDGPAMWKTKLAYDLERSNWDESKVDQLQWKIDQILYGRDHRPFFTFFLATLQKL